MNMRVIAFAVAAAVAVCAASAAGAQQQQQQQRKRIAQPLPAAGTTYLRHTDEAGRTRTKILVQKRSYLDGGTEVMPGGIQSDQGNLIGSFSYNPSRSSVSNDSVVPGRPITDPFFLPGKNNPFFN